MTTQQRSYRVAAYREDDTEIQSWSYPGDNPIRNRSAAFHRVGDCLANSETYYVVVEQFRRSGELARRHVIRKDVETFE